MNNRKQLAELIQAWADNPDSYFIRYDGIGTTTPSSESNLNEWKLVIPPKEQPMQKYIELNLDMEFTCLTNTWHIGKLTKIYDKVFTSKNNARWTKCRLRPNHVHWWDGKSDINPIPENCEYRIYINDGWGVWAEYAYSLTDPWENILAFEIRYLK